VTVFGQPVPLVLVVYFLMLAVSIGYAWPVRMGWTLFGPPGEGELPDLDPYEAALLRAGELATVYSALAALTRRGSLAPSLGERRLRVTGVRPVDVHPLEEAVYKALTSLPGTKLYGAHILGGVRVMVKPALAEVEERLDRRGLRVSKARGDGLAGRSFAAMFATACAGLILGMFEMGPSGTLSDPTVLWMAFTPFVLGVGLVLFHPRLTSRGRWVVRRLAASGHRIGLPAAVSDGAEGREDDEADPLHALAKVLVAHPEPGKAEDAPGAGQPAEAPMDLGEYGYYVGTDPRPCSASELAVLCGGGEAPSLVWTPQSSQPQHPARVPFLFERIRGRVVQERFRKLRSEVMGTAVWLAFWGFGGFGFPSFWLILVAVTGVGVFSAFREWRRAKALTPEAVSAPPPPVEISEWAELAALKRPLYTRWLVGAIAAVGAVQLLPGYSGTAAAGMVKHAIRAGEWWRLATGGMLHANPIHFTMNMVALLVFGRLAEMYGRRAYVPLVFFLSVLGGGVASVLWTANDSVGASGGIAGLLGYLLVLGWRYRRALPPNFVTSLLYVVGVNALIGAVGYGIIDNAAHAGGLVTGAALGVILLPATPPDEDAAARMSPAGIAFLAPTLLACAGAIAAILRS
jgi:uncharacterized protein (TIGR04222 family)